MTQLIENKHFKTSQFLDLIPMTRKHLQCALQCIEDFDAPLEPLGLRNFLFDCHLTTDETVIIEVILRNLEKTANFM